MNAPPPKFLSDNLKSAIQKSKMGGDLCYRSHIRLRWGWRPTAQQPTKIPPDRLSHHFLTFSNCAPYGCVPARPA